MDAAGNTDSEWATVLIRLCGAEDGAALRADVEFVVAAIKRQTTQNVLDHQRAERAAAEFPDTLERLRQ